MAMLISNIKPATLTSLKTGSFLLIIQPQNVPPHIAMLCNAQYFDVNYKTSHCGTDILKINKVLNGKRVLAFELPDISTEIIRGVFSKYSKIPENSTCLWPVKETLSEVFHLPLYDVKMVFELIPVLYEKQLIKNVYGQNIHSTGFLLKTYTENDIQNGIDQLRRKEKITF